MSEGWKDCERNPARRFFALRLGVRISGKREAHGVASGGHSLNMYDIVSVRFYLVEMKWSFTLFFSPITLRELCVRLSRVFHTLWMAPLKKQKFLLRWKTNFFGKQRMGGRQEVEITKWHVSSGITIISFRASSLVRKLAKDFQRRSDWLSQFDTFLFVS